LTHPSVSLLKLNSVLLGSQLSPGGAFTTETILILLEFLFDDNIQKLHEDGKFTTYILSQQVGGKKWGFLARASLILHHLLEVTVVKHSL